ncbi:hypothetical protein [Bradyrhizobium monzae]|uniref:hypothetical protein n=1 Tax=Bradyrhizobium sp. Oc8 TaxID=2876780 RepID=UPI001F2F8EA9|nr:hypothetical protein [Bradyrhizobium sp. Oc8]
MTVFVYVNTAKQVGDKDHVKVFASTDAAETWFEENDPEGWRLNMRFSNEPDGPQDGLRNACYRGALGPLADSWLALAGMNGRRPSRPAQRDRRSLLSHAK